MSQNTSQEEKSKSKRGLISGRFLLEAGGALAVVLLYWYWTKSQNNGNKSRDKERSLPPGITPYSETTPYETIDMKDTEESDEEIVIDEREKEEFENAMEASKDNYMSGILKERRFGSVLQNKHLNHGKTEYYFHLGMNSKSEELGRFTRIKWLLIVKSPKDVTVVAKRLLDEFPSFYEGKSYTDVTQPIGDTGRYRLLQIGPCAIVSCGIGAPSLSILLQEATKLLVDAGAFSTDDINQSSNYDTSYVEYILLTTAPGIGVAPSKFMVKRRKSLDQLMSLSNASGSTPSTPTHPGSARGGSAGPRGVGTGKPTQFAFPAQSASSNSLDMSRNTQGLERSQSYTSQQTKSILSHMKANEATGAGGHPSPSITNDGSIPVVLPSQCYNEQLLKKQMIMSCGKMEHRLMKFDRHLVNDMKLLCRYHRQLKPKSGKGLSVTHFHECISLQSVAVSQPNNVKADFIQKCMDNQVKYIDTESGYLASFCCQMHISSLPIVGIEYDITAAKNSNSMRVSHEKALQAALDVLCQYLYDRLFSEKALEQKKKLNKNLKSMRDKGFTPKGPAPYVGEEGQTDNVTQ